METKKLTEQMAHEAISRTLAKSVALKNKWISKDTGVYFDLHQAVRKSAFDASVFFGMKGIHLDLNGTERIFYNVINSLDPLQDEDVINICIHNRHFLFFTAVFDGKAGEKLLVRELHEQYKRDIDPDRGITGFTSDLKAWAKETRNELRFFNMRSNRKVMIYG